MSKLTLVSDKTQPVKKVKTPSTHMRELLRGLHDGGLSKTPVKAMVCLFILEDGSIGQATNVYENNVPHYHVVGMLECVKLWFQENEFLEGLEADDED